MTRSRKKGAADAPARLGASYLAGGRCSFSVWAPARPRVRLRLDSQDGRLVPLELDGEGYWRGVVEGVEPGALYRYELEGAGARPDPASLSQPRGVHGPSEVLDRAAFRWTDGAWRGMALEKLVLYELHVGAFSPEGTFEAVIPRLGELAALGVTAIELMPVAQFPGERNWGYDGVYPFAVQASYGGAAGLKKLVDAAHRRGLAVLLDVVYNHLGPEGNYLADFGPYFTDRYRTPWGSAVNFDGPESDHVRLFFMENALSWLRDFHLDGLRLDAVHAIHDFSARPFLAELSEAVEGLSSESGVPRLLIAESDLNDVRVLRRRREGGLQLDAQWLDDFQHALHVAVTGERTGYYADFEGLSDLAASYNEAFVYSGRYSAHRRRRHGNSAAGFPGRAFVAFAQNHDQVGNRRLGRRLSALTDLERHKLAAAALLCAPFVPMLFMGEEYGETAPFLYFVSHGDPELVEAVRAGRRREFERFAWEQEPPDPQAETTFADSKLHWALRDGGLHALMLEFYRELLRLRSGHPALAGLDRGGTRAEADPGRKTLELRRTCAREEVLAVMNFSDQSVAAGPPAGDGWRVLLDSADGRWAGPGGGAGRRAPWSVVLYGRER